MPDGEGKHIRSRLAASARKLAVPSAIFAIAASIYLSGSLEFIERQLIDARQQVITRSTGQDILVVAIDPESLLTLGAWPWPRRWHAQVIDTLYDRGADRVVVDIDLSSPTNKDDDFALAGVLARHGSATVLAGFKNSAPRSGNTHADATPLDMFRQHTSLAAVVLRPDPDGKIRRMPSLDNLAGTIVPTLAAALTSSPSTLTNLFYVDFAIDVSDVPMVPYVDVLDGRVGPELISGATVIIGATSSQLGTWSPVPHYRTLPATLVHVLGGRSLMDGRALERPSLLFTLTVTALLAFALWAFFRWRRSVRDTAILAGVVCAASAGTAMGAYAAAPVLLDTTPWFLTALFVVIASLMEHLRTQRQRIASMALARRKSSRLLALMSNTLEEAVITADANGLILSANLAASRMFATPRRALVGHDIAEFFPPGASAPTTGVPMLRNLVGHNPTTRRVARRADGSGFPVDLTARTFSGDDPAAYLLTIHDISEYEQAEQRRREVEQQFLEAMESFGEPFAMYDANDRLTMCNTAFRDLYLGRPEIVQPGTTFSSLVNSAIDLGALKLAKRQGEVWQAERQGLAKGGAEKISRNVERGNGRWYQAIDQRTSSGGFITILLDVSEAKQREAEIRDARDSAEHANHAKSEFLANMSHELRTPLNAVIGFSEMIVREMRGPIGSAAYVDYGRAINQSASHLLNIVDDILDLSRIEAGSLVLREEPIDLAVLIAGVRETLISSAREIEVRIDVSMRPGLPALWADSRLLKQILINLLSNAVKFSSPGDTVCVIAETKDDGAIRLSVVDTGIGIAEKDIPAILEPFGQVENAMTRSHDGLGLGLSLAQMFCKAHDAVFTVESEVGVGTTVIVEFPASRSRAPRAIAE